MSDYFYSLTILLQQHYLDQFLMRSSGVQPWFADEENQ